MEDLLRFSIIIPTRKRTNLLDSLLKSIANKSSDLSTIETFVICDTDDNESIDFLVGKGVKLLTRERGNNLSTDYYNWAVQYTSGEYLWPLNDDVEIETMNWDVISYRTLQGKRIALGNVRSNHYDYEGEVSAFTYFPILGRQGVERLGYIFPNGYAGWGADSILWEIYLANGCVVDLTEISVRHTTGRKLQDECYFNMKYWTEHNNTSVNVHNEIGRLRECLQFHDVGSVD